jgi:hypothetical protein
MEDMQEFPRVDTLASCGLHKRGDDAVGLYPFVRSCPETDLPEDHHVPERLFGMIIRRRHAGDAKEGQEMLALRADEIAP